MTYKQAQERYGIQGRSTVLVWLRNMAGHQIVQRMEQSRALERLCQTFLNFKPQSSESKN